MTKRDEAYELFNQGKDKTALEVVALGLKAETIDRYQQDWKALQKPEQEPKPGESRNEAYELFSQGRGPGHAEVEALGLDPSTAKEYYQDWRAAQGPIEPTEPIGEVEPEAGPEAELVLGEPVEVVSLKPLQRFGFKGRVYGKHRVHSGGVTCVSREGDKVITIPPDTLVKPEEPEEPEEPAT